MSESLVPELKENMNLSESNFSIDLDQTSSYEKNILTGFHRVDFSNMALVNHRRLKFIDGFKGAAVLLYMFCISGGGNYRSFTPVSWHLMSFSDAVFPSLLFITGVSTSLAFNYSQHPSKRWPLILARFFVSWILGLVMSNKSNSIQFLHFSGMLQTIALSYLLICALEIILPI